MCAQKRQIFVTNALPYANGDIHLGHLVGYIQADIWVRYQRMCGHTVHYICADDTHGTPIMLKAEQLGITPEELINKAHAEHARDFADFSVAFDHYYTTHSPENKAFAEEIYTRLRTAGLIATRTIEQLYDEQRQMFLPDRFVKGECPRCAAKDQYGDNCEVCGAAYQPTELNNPYSVVSGSTPVLKPSEHFFFKLSDPQCVDFLRQWLPEAGRLQPEAVNKLKEWLGEPDQSKLSDWDISRDAPYFGFEIPGAAGKYFYVWLDAPIGYFASLQNYAAKKGFDIAPFIESHAAQTAQTEMVHFIGKDILYFHALFWPAMLEFSGFRTPTQYAVNGFLTVDGAKMSKSRGTFITARSYLDQGLNPEWLRYYVAAKSSGYIEDVDLNLDDFIARINSDLIGKYVNIASRAAGFISKRFAGQVTTLPDNTLLEPIKAASKGIAAHYEQRQYAAVLREIALLADSVNAHVDQTKPWTLAKNVDQSATLHGLCSLYIETFRLLTLYLKPVLPQLAQQVESFLNIAPLTWDDIEQSLSNKHVIKTYQHVMVRIERAQIDALVQANSSTCPVTPQVLPSKVQEPSKPKAKLPTKDDSSAPDSAYVSIDDFARLDLRVAKVLACQQVEGSDKLLQFTVDLGEEKPRNIFSGIRAFYPDPSLLVGELVVVVANLAPRKMRFGISEGMILSASDNQQLYLLGTHSAAQVGMRIS